MRATIACTVQRRTRYQCELSEAEINAYYDLPQPELPILEQLRAVSSHPNIQIPAILMSHVINLKDIFLITIINISIHDIAISIYFPEAKLGKLAKLRKDRMRKQKVSADIEDEEVPW